MRTDILILPWWCTSVRSCFHAGVKVLFSPADGYWEKAPFTVGYFLHRQALTYRQSSDRVAVFPENTVAARKKSIDFEQSLAQLETLVSSLEAGEMNLEESLKAFEKGIRITRECQDALKEAEQRVEMLTRNREGDITAAPFDRLEDGE